MKSKILSLVMALLTVTSVFTACTGEDKNSVDTTDNSAVSGDTADSYDGKLEFDRSMELEYAKCFSVDYYKGGYKIAKLVDGTTMLVVPEGMSVPADAPKDAIILQQPVSNLLVSSTPVTSLINAIGALDAVSLTTYDVDSRYIDEVKNALNTGKLTYIGEHKEPDYELITASGAEVAFWSTMLTDEVKAQVEQLGLRIVLDQSAEEDHPLARVEWAKLYDEIFSDERVSTLYEIERGSYNSLLGSVELARPVGEAKLFLIGGAGYGVKHYRALQKASIAFSSGILWENDIDHAVASVLAEEVVAVKPFAPITDAEISRARQIIGLADAVIDCGCPIGEYNRANGELLRYADSKVRKELPI